MTTPHHDLPCPWCAHDAGSRSEFRTHLMVEHRKSELASFVLETATDSGDASGAEAPRSDDADEQGREDEEASDRELVAQ